MLCLDIRAHDPSAVAACAVHHAPPAFGIQASAPCNGVLLSNHITHQALYHWQLSTHSASPLSPRAFQGRVPQQFCDISPRARCPVTHSAMARSLGTSRRSLRPFHNVQAPWGTFSLNWKYALHRAFARAAWGSRSCSLNFTVCQACHRAMCTTRLARCIV